MELPVQRGQSQEQLDLERIKFDSDLARKAQLPLSVFVERYRGQSDVDGRPNKDLYELPIPSESSLRATTEHWNQVVREGVKPVWTDAKPYCQAARPKNHNSIQDYLPQIRKHINKDHTEGRYLIVDAALLAQWTDIFISPLGVTAKSGTDGDDIRVINDYSRPIGASVNAFTDQNALPAIAYNPPRDIAARIYRLRSDYPNQQILMMLGDVAGAFRHVPIHAAHVHMFAFLFDGFLVIDLCCGFGWCESPAHYALAGTLIHKLYESQRPVDLAFACDTSTFSGNVWCDDHTCVEVDTGSRCFEANLALRKAISTVLGPHAINHDKFTSWLSNAKALGLLWDTTFLDHERRRLTNEVIDDLRWFLVVLQQEERFNAIPVQHFAKLTEPSVHVIMDASDTGLCAIEPTLKQYLRVKFSDATRQQFATSKTENSINVRELMSAVLAALHWGPSWQPTDRERTHVCYHIDNTNAVSWLSKRNSPHPMARLYSRLLSLAEFQYSLVFSARHIPGEMNTMADAGSRVWCADDPLFTLWTDLSCTWLQVPVLPPYDNLSKVWESCSATPLSLSLPQPSIRHIGINGARFQSSSGGHHGSPNQGGSVTSSSDALQFTVGATGLTENNVETTTTRFDSSSLE